MNPKPFELTHKYPQNLQTPKIFIVLPTPPPPPPKKKYIYEIQEFEPQQ